MRASFLLGSILLLALPLAAADDESTFNCHSWEVFVGDREQGVGVSTDDGATYAAAATWYVVNDGPPGLNPWLFSIWVYQESNGMPGLQRADEVCDDTNGGQDGECDCTIL